MTNGTDRIDGDLNLIFRIYPISPISISTQFVVKRGNELGAEDDPLSLKPNFLLEGVRYNARQILERWAVLEVLPIASTIC